MLWLYACVMASADWLRTGIGPGAAWNLAEQGAAASAATGRVGFKDTPMLCGRVICALFVQGPRSRAIMFEGKMQ